ncbi:MAG: SDR family NAD(P)-dependent oxidoreductase [Gemmatimonadales bacterium]|nr:SDR family NAD(P)-dependent oxidoreductase [Gemmatimonadales bacterium]
MTEPRVAFVTGATEGIGRAVAFALGGAGWRVGFCARTERRVDGLERELVDAGIAAAGAAADVGNEHEVQSAVAGVTSRLGPIDTLVNNAGVLVAKPFLDLSLAEWDHTIATNLRSMFLVTREVLPGMLERRRGDIVNVASLAGRNGFVGGTAYAASKHAVLGFSKSLMLEVRKEAIRVIAICPGSVATGMLENQPLLAANADRILRPDDVAATILAALQLPGRALVSELDIRPTNP